MRKCGRNAAEGCLSTACQWPLQELQLVAAQEPQLLSEAGRTERSELPKLQADMRRCTSPDLQWGQLTSMSLRSTSFSNFLAQAPQRYSNIGMLIVLSNQR